MPYRILISERMILMVQTYKLWENEGYEIFFYPSLRKTSDATVVIFPGGGYAAHAAYEGESYAQLFNTFGMNAFVINYRVTPNHFPLPLLDARRAVRFVRYNAEKFGIDKNKVMVMGSSAGGHLAALVSTYTDPIDGEGIDEIDRENYLPNAQILCYAVISSDESIYHGGSYQNLLGDRISEKDSFSPERLVNNGTAPAFIWHTASDPVVNVANAYRYAEALSKNGVAHELHVFPYGQHGLGLGELDGHVAQWTVLLRRWLTLNGYLR